MCNRREQRKAATRQKLLDAARSAIAQKGYDAVDVIDITERANISRATFYKYFKNKEACVRELMQQGFDDLLEELLDQRRVTDDLDLAWALHSFVRIFQWAQENRALLLVMVGGAASPDLNSFGRGYMTQVIERTLTVEFAAVRERLGGGKYPPVIQAQAITGIMIQFVGWWLENETGYTPQQMGRIVRDIVISGVGMPEQIAGLADDGQV